MNENKPQPSVEPTNAQRTWMELGYGMFIHFGPNAFTNQGWGDGNFPPEFFEPRHLDVAQWAGVAAEAGMKYAVLTSKHHDGFCLWPTRHTPYSVAQSPRRQDIVGLFVEEFRKAGIQTGLYYSLWDRNYPHYADDEAYAQFMRDQIEELLFDYGPILQLWFDGAWDKDHPPGMPWYDPSWETDPSPGYTPGTRWQWQQLYEHIHNLQPDCLVMNNSSSNRPGEIRYHPVDVRTAEHFNFVWQDKVCPPNYSTTWIDNEGKAKFLPLEFCATLAQHWFWQNSGGEVHPSAVTICDWHKTARDNGANLLLNVGPSKDGLVPQYNADFLNEARRIGEF